jgi:hypothetical protein
VYSNSVFLSEQIFDWEPEGFGINSRGKYDRALLERDLDDKVKNYKMPTDLKNYILSGANNTKIDVISQSRFT